ncbi:PorV/PorQ family protein [candidate division WOR-3 bacterium]|nr:PorV/PorQ family protein [candidate division WOR-3 bacterium]
MNFKRIILLFMILVICGFAAQRPGATFLLIPPTANATGMAYAYTAVSDDASVNYYNAAALAFFESPKITMNYCGYQPGLSPDMHYVYCGLAYPLSKSAWGFDAIYFTPGKTEVLDEFGNYLGERFVWRLALKINYSRRISNNLSFGIGWKFIRQQYALWDPWMYLRPIGIDGSTGSAWAFDFNGLYKIFPNFSLGTVLHNIGPNISYSDAGASDPLPRLFRLGIAYKPIDNKYFSCSLSGEVTKVLVSMFAQEENSFWEDLKYEFKEAWKGIGLELTFYKIISLRSGYFYDMEGARKGFTFGGGINIKNFELDIGIDESIYDFPTENRKISLSYAF